MFKKCLILLAIVLSTSFSYGQTRLPGVSTNRSSNEGTIVHVDNNSQLKKDIEDVGLSVANRLMRCCSSWGGNNVYSKIDYENIRENKATGAYTIPMVVGWYGSLTGNHYWIKGKLLVSSHGREWLKIKDSGGFNPGCSKNCIN